MTTQGTAQPGAHLTTHSSTMREAAARLRAVAESLARIGNEADQVLDHVRQMREMLTPARTF